MREYLIVKKQYSLSSIGFFIFKAFGWIVLIALVLLGVYKLYTFGAASKSYTVDYVEIYDNESWIKLEDENVKNIDTSYKNYVYVYYADGTRVRYDNSLVKVHYVEKCFFGENRYCKNGGE